MLLEELDENGGLINTLLMKDDKGSINYQAVTIVFALPILTCIGICFIFLKGDNTQSANNQVNQQKKEA